MCMVSNVMDQSRGWIEKTERGYYPFVSPNTNPLQDLERVRTIQETIEQARKFDEATDQPDCEDAEKVKLIDRIAELERKLSIICDETGIQV